MADADLPKQIRNSAIGLLARREHSLHELRQKLFLRYPNSGASIEDVLTQLRSEGYQSDLRYAEAYTRSRENKGYGSRRLRQELRLRGVDAHLIDEVLNDCVEASDLDQLFRVWQKKFKTPPQDAREKFRQIAFLRYRGFSTEEIQLLFTRLRSESS